MILDTSAVVAILEQEPEAERFAAALAGTACAMSAATLVEASIAIAARRGAAGCRYLDRLLEEAAVQIVPVSAEHARIAREAYLRFGKGRHPAGLNYGDCFSYALAVAAGQPLLFKGDDFGQTDVKRVSGIDT